MRETARRSMAGLTQSVVVFLRGWGWLQYRNMEGDKILEYINQKVE